MSEFEEALKVAEQEKMEREEKLNKEIIELTRERDNLQMDVIGVENANKDYQRRFELVRERIEEFKEVGKWKQKKKKCLSFNWIFIYWSIKLFVKMTTRSQAWFKFWVIYALLLK